MTNPWTEPIVDLAATWPDDMQAKFSEYIAAGRDETEAYSLTLHDFDKTRHTDGQGNFDYENDLEYTPWNERAEK